MRPESEIRCIMAYSLKQLDRSMGIYTTGRIVSGNRVPSYKDAYDREDPLRLTQRVMVRPLMIYLGYRDIFSQEVFDGRVPGVALATVMMNSDLPAAASRVLCAMNADDAPRGIATDGFRWVLAEKMGRANRVRRIIDLRPYYIEMLELDRFRSAYINDSRILREYAETFGRKGQESYTDQHVFRCSEYNGAGKEG